MLLTSPWLEAISTVTVHFAATSDNSITFKSLKLFAMSFAEYEEAKVSASAAAAASMRTVVVRNDANAAAAAYYIATADFIGVSRRTRRSDAASDAVSCVNETNKS
ncbi:hypothetical protein F2Q70_00016686 [Brassica cretica]|uniref:Uncharacterized protein n=1 Tax=Brassica cretica TaxID=69181 RepID=A0A8S9I1L1_BRACR|nr:hypothetical protein F2Q70_00016686 [Brassica cretica]